MEETFWLSKKKKKKKKKKKVESRYEQVHEAHDGGDFLAVQKKKETKRDKCMSRGKCFGTRPMLGETTWQLKKKKEEKRENVLGQS